MLNNDTLITSSGIIKNRSKPRAGIINANNLYDDLFQDCLNDGIDLTWETFEDETKERLKSENPLLDDIELEELFEKESDCIEFDSRVFLLGAWIKNSRGQYEINKTGKNGSYALEYNTESGIVCIEWSQLTTKCGHTSPCYVMSDGSGPCGDLGSKGDSVIAYTLPKDMFRDNQS